MRTINIIGWLLVILCSCKKSSPPLFISVSPAETGVDFRNELKESESFNIIEYLYFYNGGGVSIGDINNDGLSDIYFSSNQGSNKLYLNKGDFKFENITSKAGVAGLGNWKTGITMADVNADGYLDIYLCGVGSYKSFNGFNQLFINNGDLTFTERAKEYGLFFQGLSTQSTFFDYDLDGDLDMYLLNHSVHSQRTYGRASLRYEVDSLSGDRLYKNQLVESGKPFFADVTRSANVLSSHIGYGLGVGISDLNKDGYPDVYVSNDFSENDYVYINTGEGTFQLQELSHSSRFSMGNDIADINNDQWPDIFTTDMLPADESILKSTAGEDSYEIYKFKLEYGYGKQVSRNALQLNNGRIDSGKVYFNDVALFSGVAATDWSWSPLIADFDGDGLKDLFISNGIVRRPNGLDYINYISSDSIQRKMRSTVLPMLERMPIGKVPNYFFKNNGDLTFQDKSNSWIESKPSFSTGAAYSDLDNDGDLDLVVNNVEEEATLFRNTSSANSITIELEGDNDSKNRLAIGSTVILHKDGVSQEQELNLTRGWCSSSDSKLVFGLGIDKKYDSIVVVWPDRKKTVIPFLKDKRHLIISYNQSRLLDNHDFSSPKKNLVSSNVQVSSLFKHNENEFNAFDFERLLPHMLSTEGPRIAIGDVNGDQLLDFFVAGGSNQTSVVFRQLPTGSFVLVPNKDLNNSAQLEDIDAAFIDVDGDRDLDLVVVSGGQETQKFNRHRLYLNDGKGTFSHVRTVLNDYSFNASCVKPADFDSDGDIDLFIGADVIPKAYGVSPESSLFLNDGKGNFSFFDGWLGASHFLNAPHENIGMVKDAFWVDIDKDSRLDMIVVGEWMPITILIQQPNHTFLNKTSFYGLDKTQGWWNRIEGSDIDNDGDIDFVLGNLGLNSRLKVSLNKPLNLYNGDFDSNGGVDQLMMYYNGKRQSPFYSRDQLVKQVPSLKKKFPYYYNFENAQLDDILDPSQISKATKLEAFVFASVLLKNNNGSFELIPLPSEAQFFPIKAIQMDDINGDGKIDVLLAGNLTATQPDFGPYDAGYGVVLLGNGLGGLRYLEPGKSGFFVKGEARDIKLIESKSKKTLYLVSRNNDWLLGFQKQ
ncbi:MAG: VCBS repeat-containing protein [Cytophagales bacterium]|jgi:hypothetical protein|nr:VCBS repeat-containing protein [Cytophagales bacterium]MCA6392805.1 VCBS repeat-containing protein [Cytophagales bacterium]MCA6395706.1 VCBS repeat-containing protein [Cytophagales bacterium]MCA6403897.1 VCBS repeat-containing protein [Cytophagales bacterium]MCA6412629.1 VCBS repeat-containing protein [Cytophagales bacterium]